MDSRTAAEVPDFRVPGRDVPRERHRFPTKPGWSGGPLFTRNSEVCGLLNSSDTQTSVFISCGATREAFTACRERMTEKRSLYVFGSKACGPCQKFKQHYAEKTVLRQRLDAAYSVTYVDIDVYPAAAEPFGIQQVPRSSFPASQRSLGMRPRMICSKDWAWMKRRSPKSP